MVVTVILAFISYLIGTVEEVLRLIGEKELCRSTWTRRWAVCCQCTCVSASLNPSRPATSIWHETVRVPITTRQHNLKCWQIVMDIPNVSAFFTPHNWPSCNVRPRCMINAVSACSFTLAHRSLNGKYCWTCLPHPLCPPQYNKSKISTVGMLIYRENTSPKGCQVLYKRHKTFSNRSTGSNGQPFTTTTQWSLECRLSALEN